MKWEDEEEALWEEHSHTCWQCGRTFSHCQAPVDRESESSVPTCPACEAVEERKRDRRDEGRRKETLMARLGCTASDTLHDAVLRACAAWDEEGANWVAVERSNSWHHPLHTLWAVWDETRNPDRGEFLALVGREWKRAIGRDLEVWGRSRSA